MSLQSSFITTALIGSLVFIGGCSTFDSTWKSTKAFYGEYINPPAQIDYDDKGVLNDAETTLASRMVGIDIQLEQLERYLQNSDKPPTGESLPVALRPRGGGRQWHGPRAGAPGGHERA